MSHAYLNHDPAAVEAFRVRDAQARTWGLDLTAAAVKIGALGAFGSRSFDGSWTIYGLSPKPGAPVPTGWRWTPSRGCLRPIPGKAGAPAREWLQRWSGIMSAIRLLTEQHGLGWTSRTETDPKTGESQRAWARVDIVPSDGVAVLVAHHQFDRVDPSSDVWAEIPLSQYHALLEQAGVAA